MLVLDAFGRLTPCSDGLIQGPLVGAHALFLWQEERPPGGEDGGARGGVGGRPCAPLHACSPILCAAGVASPRMAVVALAPDLCRSAYLWAAGPRRRVTACLDAGGDIFPRPRLRGRKEEGSLGAPAGRGRVGQGVKCWAGEGGWAGAGGRGKIRLEFRNARHVSTATRRGSGTG